MPDVPRRQPKREAANQKLQQIAHKAGAGAQLPTFMELCQVLQISKGTLDSVLTELEQLNLVERRHGVGIFVSKHVFRPLLLFCPLSTAESPSVFWTLLLNELKSQARAGGAVLYPQPYEDEPDSSVLISELLQCMQHRRAQGVLAVELPIYVSDALAQHVPVVSFASYATCMVSLDFHFALRGGIWHLTQRGCRNVAYWDACNKNELNEQGHVPEQINEVRSALAANNVPFKAGLVQTFHQDAATSPAVLYRQGYQRAKQVFGCAAQERPDGLLSTNDYVTRGAIQALDELGIATGETVIIATYSNRGSDVLETVADRVIQMQFNPAVIASEMLDMLNDAMEGRQQTGGNRYVRPIPVVPEKLKISV